MRLHKRAGEGPWNAMRKLRKGTRHCYGRLKAASGELLSRELKCDTFAKLVYDVQWAVRPATPIEDKPALYPDLEVEQGRITMHELQKTVRAFKLG